VSLEKLTGHQRGGMVRLTFEKWHEHQTELEDLRRENEDLRRRQGDVVWERQVAPGCCGDRSSFGRRTDGSASSATTCETPPRDFNAPCAGSKPMHNLRTRTTIPLPDWT
jgi:hypothetical protein